MRGDLLFWPGAPFPHEDSAGKDFERFDVGEIIVFHVEYRSRQLVICRADKRE